MPNKQLKLQPTRKPICSKTNTQEKNSINECAIWRAIESIWRRHRHCCVFVCCFFLQVSLICVVSLFSLIFSSLFVLFALWKDVMWNRFVFKRFPMPPFVNWTKIKFIINLLCTLREKNVNCCVLAFGKMLKVNT